MSDNQVPSVFCTSMKITFATFYVLALTVCGTVRISRVGPPFGDEGGVDIHAIAAFQSPKAVVRLPVPPSNGMAKSGTRSSDVNLKHLVRGQDERNHARCYSRAVEGVYVTDRKAQSRGSRS